MRYDVSWNDVSEIDSLTDLVNRTDSETVDVQGITFDGDNNEVRLGLVVRDIEMGEPPMDARGDIESVVEMLNDELGTDFDISDNRFEIG